jgi:hypothetical protein
MSAAFPIYPAHTAVLSMDCQSGIVSIYAGDQKDAFLARIASTLNHARASGMTVIRVRVGFRPGLPEINSQNLLFGAIKSSIQRQRLFVPARNVRKRAICTIRVFLATASHGVLDATTNGGLGVAFFSPFDNRRYFLPWRPSAFRRFRFIDSSVDMDTPCSKANCCGFGFQRCCSQGWCWRSSERDQRRCQPEMASASPGENRSKTANRPKHCLCSKRTSMTRVEMKVAGRCCLLVASIDAKTGRISVCRGKLH